jgi:L-lactate dehydrogenase complex protein LldG
MAARDEILARVRAANQQATAPAAAPPAPRWTQRPADIERFVDRLVDYKALVSRCDADGLAAAIGAALEGVSSVVVPHDLPDGWLTRYSGDILNEGVDLDSLGTVGSVVTGCALGIAETGTIVLDAGAAQGRRALTLIPDHHVCVVREDQVLADVPDAVARLTPSRPLTWISGPSATSDIELNRVEGVHGPRRLHVVLVA